MKKWMGAAVAAIVLATAVFAIYNQFLRNDAPGAGQPEPNAGQPAGFDKSLYPIDESGSLWWIVNKRRPLPEDYIPADMAAPEMKLRWADDAESMQVSTKAIPDLEALYRAAAGAGHELMLVSAYRSAGYQRQLYEGYVRSSGQDDADRFSARPGTSEHQTGLAVDLGRVDGECEIEECFGQTAEGKWLAANAHKYGFVVRYLKDKENITGYLYEPWHFRYVGKELADEIKQTGQTLEEFFGLEPAPDYAD
jgi:D-alanyl-D-alanine carboxypeptidase